MKIKKIGAAKFKEKCLAILDQIDRDGIIITKHGKPLAKLIAINRESSYLIGSLKEKLKIKGNIYRTGVKWNAES